MYSILLLDKLILSIDIDVVGMSRGEVGGDEDIGR